MLDAAAAGARYPANSKGLRSIGIEPRADKRVARVGSGACGQRARERRFHRRRQELPHAAEVATRALGPPVERARLTGLVTAQHGVSLARRPEAQLGHGAPEHRHDRHAARGGHGMSPLSCDTAAAERDSNAAMRGSGSLPQRAVAAAAIRAASRGVASRSAASERTSSGVSRASSASTSATQCSSGQRLVKCLAPGQSATTGRGGDHADHHSAAQRSAASPTASRGTPGTSTPIGPSAVA
jgi:hypothetical protein